MKVGCGGILLLTSFDPRQNPDTTFPFIRKGKGGSGPASLPIIEGRGPLGGILRAW